MLHLWPAGKFRSKILIPISLICWLCPIAAIAESDAHRQSPVQYRRVEDRLRPDELVTLHRQAGADVVGTFRGFDYATNEILIQPKLGRAHDVLGYDLELVERLEYSRKGQIVDEAIFGGLIIGGVLGAAIGYALDHPQTSYYSYDGYDFSSRREEGVHGAALGLVVGAFVGAAAGTIIPAVLPKTFVIEF